MSAHGVNLLVFREGRREASGQDLKLALKAQLDALRSNPSRDAMIASLLRAGELECGVADAAIATALPFSNLTQSLADALLRGQLSDDFDRISRAALDVPVPARLTVSTPEGFAYYALHPLAYATVLDKIPALPEKIVVVGIRSIGVTLSAVTAAAARLRGGRFPGTNVERVTVRPMGHPYNRRTEFSLEQHALLRSALAAGAGFLVVDEGPGLSGSSFLSVGEALEAAGAARERIILLCGHEPNAETLCSTDAAQRWRRFCCVAAGGEACKPATAEDFIGGGRWRTRLFRGELNWPAGWTSLERLKYLSPAEVEGRRLFKFAGLGHYGDAVLERESLVASAGFGPPPQREDDGFVSYPWTAGRPMTAGDLSPAALVRMAEYCAFRAKRFATEDVDLTALQEMAQHNLAELGFDLSVELKLEHPVIADGRMQPHEWLLTSASEMLKTDSGSHGDDHFFPGPTDIAWDLAGAVVEWRMNAAQRGKFLELYRHAGGDDANARIEDFIRAYAVFRYAYCTMAANALRGSAEAARLERAAAEYREQLHASFPALSAHI